MLLGPADLCSPFVPSYMRPGTFLLFLITIPTLVHRDPPATPLPQGHTHGHSSPGCSLCRRNATCTCHLFMKRKGKAVPDPWQPQTHISAEALPLLTPREGAGLGWWEAAPAEGKLAVLEGPPATAK